MKIAIVYDRINKWGGAERVLLALHKIFPEAPIYTSVYSKEKAPWAEVFSIKSSYLQKVNFFHNNNQLIPVFMPIAFESFSFDEYDLVISVTSEAAKGIITKPGTRHICYCLTPTRYLWSGFEDYFSNRIFRFVSIPFVSYLKKWDKIASTRPDQYIAISTDVKKRIKKYYNIDSSIIYPPLMIEKSKKKKQLHEDYFLFVSRMSRFAYYKKTGLVIDAFNKTGYPLKIIGSGHMQEGFQKKAKNNIEFLGDLTDNQLAYYYENCKALIFPGHEDFGLVMAEAQSFGKPVIAYKSGGALDIIIDGKTGLFFEKQTSESIYNALIRFNKKRYNTADIIRNSKRFTFDKFRKSIEDEISKEL